MAAEELVLKGLRHKFDGDVEAKVLQRQMQAKLRKGYRELFQEKLRLVLLGGSGSNDLQDLRHIYADALGADEKTRSIFDGFKFIRYYNFLRFRKIPRSNEYLAQEWVSESDGINQSVAAPYIIFFSYRWINKAVPRTIPDDTQNTQYKRMVRAAEEFLSLHPSVDREGLGIWVVSHSNRRW